MLEFPHFRQQFIFIRNTKKQQQQHRAKRALEFQEILWEISIEEFFSTISFVWCKAVENEARTNVRRHRFTGLFGIWFGIRVSILYISTFFFLVFYFLFATRSTGFQYVISKREKKICFFKLWTYHITSSVEVIKCQRGLCVISVTYRQFYREVVFQPFHWVLDSYS